MADRRLRRALILAGGESRRMGRDKAAIEVGGQPLLSRTAELAARIADSVHVGVRDANDADALRRRYALIEDLPGGHGPLGGIAAALEQDPAADWLVLACDLPHLDAATLDALVAAAESQPQACAVALASERDGSPEPMCAIWRAAMRPRIARQLAEDRRCARRCLLDAGATTIDAVTRGALDNMNTPADRRSMVGA